MIAIRRLYVTLLELLVVMSILALIAGVVGISINKALVNQRFQSEVSGIVDKFRVAQDLMLILGTDVSVKFKEKPNKDGIEYWLELETPISKSVERELLQKHQNLKVIKGVFLKDQLDYAFKEGELEIKFFSKGTVMSKGIMRIASSEIEKNIPKNTLQNYICLPGYPRPLSSSETKEAAEILFNQDNDSEFNQRLTQDTFAKLPEKIKQRNESSLEEKKEDSEDEKKGEAKKEVVNGPRSIRDKS